MMTFRRSIRIAIKCFICAVLMLLSPPVCGPARGQEPKLIWDLPDRIQRIDMAPTADGVQVLFSNESMAFERTLQLEAVHHSQFALRSQVPEEGRFEVTVLAGAVRVANERVQNGECSADVVPSYTAKSIEQLQEGARQTIDGVLGKHRQQARTELMRNGLRAADRYLRSQGETPPDDPDAFAQLHETVRAAELAERDVRARLEDFAKGHPAWVSDQLRDVWKAASPRQLLQHYLKALTYQPAIDYLKALGLQVDAGASFDGDRLLRNVAAIHFVISGEAIKDRTYHRDALAGLTADNRNKLLDMIDVRLRCRFFPLTSPGDANSHWYNGQRVTCQIAGVAGVSVHGRLNPAAGDRSDWWTLAGYDERQVRITFPTNAALAIQGPFLRNGRHHVRVRATSNRAVDYKIVMLPARPTASAAKDLEIHESPEGTRASFPF